MRCKSGLLTLIFTSLFTFTFTVISFIRTSAEIYLPANLLHVHAAIWRHSWWHCACHCISQRYKIICQTWKCKESGVLTIALLRTSEACNRGTTTADISGLCGWADWIPGKISTKIKKGYRNRAVRTSFSINHITRTPTRCRGYPWRSLPTAKLLYPALMRRATLLLCRTWGEAEFSETPSAMRPISDLVN